MAFQQVSPVKFEPADDMASLFPQASPAAASTVNPMDMMTPQCDDEHGPGLPAVDEPGPEAADKKPAKKRKSWGQVLPEPKTNLPPRKRAKTEDEKEQRRVERVLRNRRAAQSSRERKRLEVEALERRNKELEGLLLSAQKTNLMLVEELNRFRRDSGVVTRSSSPLDPLRDNHITLSPQLFGPHDDGPRDLVMPPPSPCPTVNPASLSPELTPVPDAGPTPATSPDLTQRPAEMLLRDLPCHMSAEVPASWPASTTTPSPRWAWALPLRLMLLSASAILSACQRPLTQIAMSSKAGFSLLPTPQLLTTIIWLVTLSPASRPWTSSTSTTSSATRQPTPPRTLRQPPQTTAPSPRSATLRFKSLRKILSSSPNLARPLMDATMEALRLVSEGCDDGVAGPAAGSDATRGHAGELTQCLRGIALPSPKVLLTLLWALRVEERRIQRKSPESGAPDKYVLTVSGIKPKYSTKGTEIFWLMVYLFFRCDEQMHRWKCFPRVTAAGPQILSKESRIGSLLDSLDNGAVLPRHTILSLISEPQKIGVINFTYIVGATYGSTIKYSTWSPPPSFRTTSLSELMKVVPGADGALGLKIVFSGPEFCVGRQVVDECEFGRVQLEFNDLVERAMIGRSHQTLFRNLNLHSQIFICH